jgi:cell division initiation protein
MDSSQPTPSILDTLRTVEFRLGLKGYNVDEVDEYLEKAAVEAESLQEQSRQVNERLRQATDKIAQLESQLRDAPAAAAEPVADESLQRTLLLAQRFVDQARRESEAEAAERVSQAEQRAQATVAAAEERARRIATESEQQLRVEVTRLETARGQLAADVENMARHLDAERNRLQGALGEVLRWIEQNVQPSKSLMALRTQPEHDEAAAAHRAADGTAAAVKDASGAGPAREVGPSGERSTGPVPHDQDDPSAGTDTMAQVLDLRGAAPTGSGYEGPSLEGR